MTHQDLDKFAEIMIALAENYPATRLSKSGLKLRFEALKEYTIEQVSAAALKLMKSHCFNTMPTVGDVVSVIELADGNISIEHQAEIQAGKVLEHLRWYGNSKSPKFDDPITRHLMSTRWRYMIWATYVIELDLKWWYRDFIRAYQAHAAGARAGYYLPAGYKIRQIAGTVTKSIPATRGCYA